MMLAQCEAYYYSDVVNSLLLYQGILDLRDSLIKQIKCYISSTCPPTRSLSIKKKLSLCNWNEFRSKIVQVLCKRQKSEEFRWLVLQNTWMLHQILGSWVLFWCKKKKKKGIENLMIWNLCFLEKSCLNFQTCILILHLFIVAWWFWVIWTRDSQQQLTLMFRTF